MRLDGGQYRLEAFGVAGNDLTLLKEVMAAAEIAHQAAGFLDQQCACSHVPFGKAKLPERIKAACSDISQVEACGAGTT